MRGDQAGRPFPAVPLLVGRERELATLRVALVAARAGDGSLVLIGGAAGVGKTALAEALLAEARAGGALALAGRCYDHAETPPYGPFLDLLRDYEPVDNLPPPPFPSWRGAGPSGSQAALYDHVLAFFQEVTAHRPLALLLDDLQWADQASLDLLRFLARALLASPLLVLATYRADELDRRHPLSALLALLERESPAIHLVLPPLGSDAIAKLVGARYWLSTADAGRLTTYVAERSEGNALFVAQLLRALEERELLRRDGSKWILGDTGELGLPAPLRRVIETRLARLDEATRALLEVAAVAGQEVPLRLWASVAGVSVADVESATAAAGATGLLAASADGASARFVHALVREAVYAGIFPPRRRALHRTAGDILAAIPAFDPDATAYHFAQGGDPRAIAWLLRAAERAERVFALRTAAARVDAALALPDEAGVEDEERGWLFLWLAVLHRRGDHQRGLAALDEAGRLARDRGDAALAARVSFERGNLRCRQGQLRRGLAELAAGVAALEALTREEWTRGHAMARPADLPDARDARSTLALFQAVTGRYVEAAALASPRAGKPPELGAAREADAEAFQAWAIVQAAQGRVAPARQAYAHARAAYEAAGNAILMASMDMQELRHVVLPYQADALADRRDLAQRAADALRRTGGMSTLLDIPPAVATLPLLILEGRWAEALELAALRDLADVRGLNALRELTGPWRGPWRGMLAGTAAALARARGETDLAQSIVAAVLPEGPATEPGGDDSREVLPLQCLAAALALDAGDLPAARNWLAAHDRWLAWSGTILGQAEGQLGWANYRRAAGEPGTALAHAEQALAMASEPRQPLAMLAARRLLGELATEKLDGPAAGAHLGAALALAEACAAPYERALTLLALAELRGASGDRDAARLLAVEARDLGATFGAAPVVGRAEAVLAVSPPTPDGAPFPAGLSAREVEILRLVAAGRANRDIAATLFLSEHTVRAHIRHIFAKTGAENRAAATAFAFQQRLV